MRHFFFLLSIFIHGHLHAQSPVDPILSLAEKELQREMSQFGNASQPPYYIAYRIDDMRSAVVTSSFGSLTNSRTSNSRILVTDVKVGDYTFDNSHPIINDENFPGGMDFGGAREGIASLPIEDRPEAFQLVLWQETQQAYRRALIQYKAAKSAAPPIKQGPQVNDFSRETPSIHIDPALPDFTELYDQQAWEKRIRKFSEPFLTNPHIVDGTASLDVGMERKYFVSSEGARIAQNRTYAYLRIEGSIRSEDGDIVPLNLSYFAFDPKALPNDADVLEDVNALLRKLNILRTAPLAEPYTGPAILHARAAGVFFHEIFGHRVEGHRLKDMNDGQTFKAKVREQVLPKTLSVVFDPTMRHYNGQALNGHYLFDDEGVKGQRVNVVEDGVLKTFLMSRLPIEEFSNSNGHGRAQAGAKVVTRQSNLLIENEKKVTSADLRKMLITECKKQKKKYGYLFMDVVGGFTTTDRFMPNAFNIFPTEVYRVYVDGRPDELVRGVDLIGTPLAMFAEITAADNKTEVFTGFCGAESGSVPVTAISPSLFVKRIETQKKPAQQLEKSVLERPDEKTTLRQNH